MCVGYLSVRVVEVLRVWFILVGIFICLFRNGRWSYVFVYYNKCVGVSSCEN